MPLSTYAGRNLPASSRERPMVAWVRSFVPNEKNSAGTASSPAIRAARGSSIIVPNVKGTGRPAFVSISRATPSTILRVVSSSARVIASGIMISGDTAMPSLVTCTAASRMSAHLHRVDLGIRDGEAAPAVPEHRVELVQVFRAMFERLDGHPHRPRELLELLRLGWQELMERRIEEADRDGQPAHLSKEADEVFALEREKLCQRGGAAARVVGQDHLAHPL